MSATRRWTAVAALALVPAQGFAHVMEVAYNLPVPLWMYAYGATGALLASFVVIGYFVKADAGHFESRTTREVHGRVAGALGAPALWRSLRVVAVALLVLTIASGLFGTSQPAANFNITFFWVIFGLAIPYLSAAVGDIYGLVNPVEAICRALRRTVPALFRERAAYPPWLGYWPALAMYIGFIWLELFGHAAPRTLSIVLLGYVVLSAALAAVFGIATWARYLDFLGIFLRLIAKMAPVEIVKPESAAGTARFRLRAPFSGLLAEHSEHLSLVVFVLFMLSSTAFDGVHDTVPWVTLFWKHLFPWIQTVGTGGHARPYVEVVGTFYYWQWLMMSLSPFAYFSVYVFFIALTKWVTGARENVGELARAFAFTLIPIAFVYHVTHYFTLLLAQGPAIVSLLSDPLGRGWNLFGTRGHGESVLLDAGTIWHTQVWLILIGHVVSVYLAHIEALRLFRSGRRAMRSQLPMLVLMVVLTTAGLWILSLPIAAGQVLEPPTTAAPAE